MFVDVYYIQNESFGCPLFGGITSPWWNISSLIKLILFNKCKKSINFITMLFFCRQSPMTQLGRCSYTSHDTVPALAQRFCLLGNVGPMLDQFLPQYWTNVGPPSRRWPNIGPSSAQQRLFLAGHFLSLVLLLITRGHCFHHGWIKQLTDLIKVSLFTPASLPRFQSNNYPNLPLNKIWSAKCGESYVLCKTERQYLHTLKVNKHCHLTLQTGNVRRSYNVAETFVALARRRIDVDLSIILPKKIFDLSFLKNMLAGSALLMLVTCRCHIRISTWCFSSHAVLQIVQMHRVCPFHNKHCVPQLSLSLLPNCQLVFLSNCQ